MSDAPRIKLTDSISVEIVDPDNIRPVYADLVTELRVVNGVLHLSLATLSVEGDDSGLSRTARVCARLRIAPHTAQFIQQILASPNDSQGAPAGQTLN